MVDISTFTTAEILDKGSGPFGSRVLVRARAAAVTSTLGGTGIDRTRSRPGSRVETYTTTPSRDIDGGNVKGKVFTNVSVLSGTIFTVSIPPLSGLSSL